MGARVTRLIRNFNVENRAHRAISKSKPQAAPRHPAAAGLNQQEAAVTEEIHQKNNPLLSMLKDVYVDSTHTASQVGAVVVPETPERRRPHCRLPGQLYGFSDVSNVPKGKLSLVEALSALNNHKLMPQTWTAEKVAKEFSLDPKDAKALIKYFIPFDVKIIPPKSKDDKKISDS